MIETFFFRASVQCLSPFYRLRRWTIPEPGLFLHSLLLFLVPIRPPLLPMTEKLKAFPLAPLCQALGMSMTASIPPSSCFFSPHPTPLHRSPPFHLLLDAPPPFLKRRNGSPLPFFLIPLFFGTYRIVFSVAPCYVVSPLVHSAAFFGRKFFSLCQCCARSSLFCF